MNANSDTEYAASADVVLWREQRLEAVGFDEPAAAEVAGDCAFDLHNLLALVAAGCPPNLAVRILAPLDGTRRPC